MKTKADLALEVISLLGKSGEGFTPSDDDLATVSDKIVPAFETLSLLQIITVNDPNNIEDGIFIPLAEYVAEQCANDFNRPKSLQNEQIAIRALRLIARALPTGERQTAEYF